MGKGGGRPGRYLCKPRSISLRQDRVPFKQPLPKMEIGHREKNPVTWSPSLRSSHQLLGSEFAVRCGMWSNLQPSVRRLVLSHPLPSFVSANGGQNVEFCLKYFVIVVESGLALGRNAEKLSEYH